MTVLLTHLPSDVRRDRLTTEILLSAYVNKLIKINNENDRWSLVSLSNNKGKLSYALVKNTPSVDNRTVHIGSDPFTARKLMS